MASSSQGSADDSGGGLLGGFILFGALAWLFFWWGGNTHNDYGQLALMVAGTVCAGAALIAFICACIAGIMGSGPYD